MAAGVGVNGSSGRPRRNGKKRRCDKRESDDRPTDDDNLAKIRRVTLIHSAPLLNEPPRATRFFPDLGGTWGVLLTP